MKHRSIVRGRWFTTRHLLFLAAAIILVVISGWWYMNRTVVEEVSYDQCEIDYGQIVAEWSGENDDEWNREGYYYRTKAFRLQAHAPDVRFPNTVEAEPTRIATGGDYACREFDEEIDTVAGYRWEGARASAVGFGAPRAALTASDKPLVTAKSPRITDRPELTTPVFAGADDASVWVDDGAAVHVNAEQLWCVNYDGCDSITGQAENKAVRGAGFQYRADVCLEEVACSEEWYNESVLEKIADEDRVEPFDLRLEAVSTYAPVVGAETLLTFRYPEAVSLRAQSIHERPMQASPGSEIAFDIDVEKTGRSIRELNVSTPSDALASLDVTDKIKDQLDDLNREDAVSLRLLAEVSDDTTIDACYQPELIFEVKYGDDAIARTDMNVEFCVEEPAVVYNYDIQTRGDTRSSVDEFTRQVGETLSDVRGWRRANVEFERIPQGGNFTMWLAAPEEMTSFAEACSPEYSCRVGDNVIINDERWQEATDSWNQAGGSIRDYRHMVVNHEVGHFLGHGHFDCPGEGQLAPVMQQQSIDLQGCEFNPWPLAFEIELL